MNAVKNLHQQEPVLTWGTIAVVFNALSLLVLPGLPIVVHTIIVMVATAASVIAARSQTVPAKDPAAVGQAAHDLGLISKVIKDASASL